jgi:hypothetical protein
MYTSAYKKASNVKITISVKDSQTERFVHDKIENFPFLEYKFGANGFWSRRDYRIADKQKEIHVWFDTFWEHEQPLKQNKYQYFGKNKTRRIKNIHRYETNAAAYERDLEQAVRNAYVETAKKWEKKLKTQFEQDFQEDVLKFLNSK